jgi:BMFP domain-containing protein YqiC
MQTDNRLLDDLARVATGAIGTLQGVKGEVEGRLRDQFERVLANMDMVTREEFDAVQAMAQAARTENEALRSRLDQLEEALAGKADKRKSKATDTDK